MSARRVQSTHHGVLPHSPAEIEFERMSAYGVKPPSLATDRSWTTPDDPKQT
jgi:hypothetical protein